ncbi:MULTISPECIES: DUF2790 domain-containing protein [Pseudomonas]|uniref:DUF2790 domain-containing protein n=1 Tax=Pseudomonas TaxID=286 RepID=UPI000C0E7392|nr:hypothetical protein [Pseudomonadaceae bacterium]HCP55314.1 DUF2790 domain-containing protein [Pseudomonas sp.]
MKSLALAVCLGLVAPWAAAATTPAAADAPVKPETYQYGDTLDVARVISQTATDEGCGVVDATIVYEDSKGETHRLQYERLGNNCAY